MRAQICVTKCVTKNTIFQTTFGLITREIMTSHTYNLPGLQMLGHAMPGDTDFIALIPIFFAVNLQREFWQWYGIP